MNYRMVIHSLGKILMSVGVLMFIPVSAGIFFKEEDTLEILLVAVLTTVIGALIQLVKPKKNNIRAKEGFVITAMAWIMLSIAGAVPFIASGSIPDFTDAVFETASGFTTTGASVIPDLEVIPRCIILWRSFTHWIGGMGILMFMMIFIPTNADDMNIMRAESPGPSVEKMVPKVKETARNLYIIYGTMTIILIIALCIAGMPFFDSVCLSFGTAGTGGFGIHGDSVAGYSTACQNIITVGMIMFGVNFNVYFLIITRKFRNLLKCEEVMWYLIIYFFASAMVTLGTFRGIPLFAGAEGVESFETVKASMHHSFFQVASVMTTTGYATVDFNKWADMPRAVMVLVMFIGACAGSTGGGMKVSRWVLYFKQMAREFQNYIHPKAVKSIRLDGKPVNNNILRTTNVFLMAYMFIFIVSFIIVLLDGFDMVTSFTAVTATINNIGPGLGMVGPSGSFKDFSILSKWVFIFDMIAGRLELFPILIMLAPGTWRRK